MVSLCSLHVTGYQEGFVTELEGERASLGNGCSNRRFWVSSFGKIIKKFSFIQSIVTLR